MTASSTIARNSAAHVALLIMKMLRRPVVIDEFTEVSKGKFPKNTRTQCLDRLAKSGYANRMSNDPASFQITRAGLDKVLELSGVKPKS